MVIGEGLQKISRGNPLGFSQLSLVSVLLGNFSALFQERELQVSSRNSETFHQRALSVRITMGKRVGGITTPEEEGRIRLRIGHYIPLCQEETSPKL